MLTADLARADAEDVTTRLGVIGQLLDMRCWIDLARRNVGVDVSAA